MRDHAIAACDTGPRMKGVVFNLLQEAVEATHGDDVWDAILADAGLVGAYTSLGSYPDEDLGRLVAAASARLGKPQDAIIRWFGARALALLATRYPQFFLGHTSVRSFVLTLNDIIHPEVRKVYPGADAPSFDFAALPGGRLQMAYRSRRRLCGFAHGLLEGAIEHFGESESVEVAHPSCTLRGDDLCTFQLSFDRVRPGSS